MVKLIFILFFLATVGIALIVKYAVRGVKAGLEYASKADEQEKAAAVHRTTQERAKLEQIRFALGGMLGVQKALLSDGKEPIPEEGKHNFSCGYVCGCCDASLIPLQLCSVLDDFRSLIFIDLYGLDDGSRLVANTLNAQTDPEFLRGILIGGRELMAWLKETDPKPPMGWAGHVIQIRSVSWLRRAIATISAEPLNGKGETETAGIAAAELTNAIAKAASSKIDDDDDRFAAGIFAAIFWQNLKSRGLSADC